MNEKWKDIKGFEGRYAVSNHGRIRSTPERQKGRILKPGVQSRGYLTVCLYDGSKPKRPQSFTVHRLVMEAFGPKPTAKQTEINHKDMDKSNNHIDNLEWCTSFENHQHAIINNQSWSGEANGKSKLTDAQVVEVLKLLDEKERPHVIADMFNLNEAYVRELRRGKYRAKAREMYAKLKSEEAAKRRDLSASTDEN